MISLGANGVETPTSKTLRAKERPEEVAEEPGGKNADGQVLHGSEPFAGAHVKKAATEKP
jgi:hypothetical protein